MPRLRSPITLDAHEAPSTVVRVGDTVRSLHKEGQITRITICTRPHADPAAELHGVEATSVEIGVLFVADIEGQGWVYGIQLTEIVAREVMADV